MTRRRSPTILIVATREISLERSIIIMLIHERRKRDKNISIGT
jgi:hypothetical protein